ncbi:SDR family oxidoreductase [Saccharopolyspora taberi]|uniref:SDR family oxidoreductase n=1 Tax=Saccharopolyspora taberi TaxID=60895 RepID=A0ABN3VDT2_9PSEU
MTDLPHDVPAQQQPPPGTTRPMDPLPRDEMREYTGRGLLAGKRALITGGDSGIGRAVAVAFGKEGADVAISFLADEERHDAEHTAALVRQEGRACVLYQGDLADERFCAELVGAAVRDLGGLDVLVNHAGTQFPHDDLGEISTEELDRTFRTNVYPLFWVTRAALRHLPEGGAVINTGSVNGLRGHAGLIDYSASKAAAHVFTMSLAQNLAKRGIRVNCVAPGPVWTPLIPATFEPERVEGFGGGTPMGRMAHPDEIAPSYVFFAAERLSSYYTGEVLAPTGGETFPG